MCERGRQGRGAHPAGLGAGARRGRPRGVIGTATRAPAPPPSGVARFVQEDGSIRRPGRTTAEELIRLRGVLDPARLDPVERLKAEAQRRVLQYLHIPSSQFAEAQEIFSLAQSALGGNPIAALRTLFSMFMAGVDAMLAGQKIRNSVCIAHTFGYWVFRHLQLSPPSRPPAGMHQREVDADALVDDGVSAALWATRWNRCHRETLHRLDQSHDIRSVRNELVQRFEGLILPDDDPHDDDDDDQVMRLFNTMIVAREFSGDPRCAASVMFLKTIQNFSRPERRSATSLYRRFPYAPLGNPRSEQRDQD